MEITYLALACLAGAIIAWLATYKKLQAAKNQQATSNETLRLTSIELTNTKVDLAQNSLNLTNKTAENASLLNEVKNLTDRLEQQKTETAALQTKLTAEFENIAARIMKSRSDEFATTNTKALGDLLNPLRERIQSFEKKVDETYDKELRDKISLREEVIKLTEMNARVSQEANNLTKALKGDVKKQGNWGEVILERVLERSGLTRGQEYEREEVVEGADNSAQRPDVIVHLPDSKHIVIDSKVSLVAYEKYVTADTDLQQVAAMRDHIASLRSHVKLLSDKNYQHATQLNSPDFVLLFIPIEASFSVAVQADGELFSYAWERKIVIVSPTTLLATLRTITSIWKQENQTKNAQDIARLSGALYDKFIGFTEDMVKIKANIDRASGSYDDALRKMKEGNGNIIRTAEKIKELGAKTGIKTLPTGFEV